MVVWLCAGLGCTSALVCDATAPQQLQCAFMWHYMCWALPFFSDYVQVKTESAKDWWYL